MADIQKLEAEVRRGLRSSLLSMGTNFLLALCKCTVGYAEHSFALIADGIESLSDVLSSSAVYFGLRFAVKPPDETHPYGHGKAEPVAAAAVAVALALAGAGIALEGISQIHTPHPCQGPIPCGYWSAWLRRKSCFRDSSRRLPRISIARPFEGTHGTISAMRSPQHLLSSES